MPVDAEVGAWEVAELWTAPDADALHRVLALHSPFRRSSDTFEPFALLKKHHESEPTTSLVTALLMLTDRRWRDAAGQLVRRIADSEILDGDALDLLAQTFLAAGDAVYWEVPDEWFGDDAIVIDFGSADANDGDDEQDEPDEPEEPDEQDEPSPQPVVVRREVFPPLRRWAATRTVLQGPESWPALLARAKELDRRGGAAVMCGLLDGINVLTPAARALLIDTGVTWSDRGVRQLALGLVAEREGAAAALTIARQDRNARIRSWAETHLAQAPDDDGDTQGGRRSKPRTLF